MKRKTQLADCLDSHDQDEESIQLNVPPAGTRGLWKVVVPGIRCPLCGSTQTKSKTGKRLNSEGFFEHYRCCLKCDSRFRVIFE